MAKPTVISSINPMPSIAVIQGDYDTLFAPGAEATFNWVLFSVANTSALPIGTDVRPEPVDDWLRFQALVDQWRHQRGLLSSTTDAAACPAYQSIIGMGPTAVPFLIAQLRAEGDDPDQWFWALKSITGQDPVHEDDRGDFRAMARTWLAWAERDENAR